jgi:hypothetical protein
MLLDLAGLMPARRKPQVRTDSSGLPETVGVTDGQNELQGSNGSNPADLAEPCSFGITLGGDTLNGFVEGVNLLVQMSDGFQQRCLPLVLGLRLSLVLSVGPAHHALPHILAPPLQRVLHKRHELVSDGAIYQAVVVA